MSEEIDQSDVAAESGENGSKKSRIALITGVALLTVGSLVAVGTKLRGKIDLDEMQQRMRSKEWPLFKSSSASDKQDDQEELESKLAESKPANEL